MATFALGLGLPFFAVGAFAMQLPKSGRWMLYVKSVLGVILCVVALYFAATVFPELTKWISPGPLPRTLGAVAIVLGLLSGAVHRSFESGIASDKPAKGLGLALAIGGSFVLLHSTLTPHSTLTWQQEAGGGVGSVVAFEHAHARAQEEGRPLLLDFTAAWCAACKELDKLTFTNEDVQREAGRFVAAKLDATDDEAPGVEATLSKFSVVGLPTVLLFDSHGNEVKRFTDFVSAKQLRSALEQTR
jgi:thiol:disulfide interchange protein DsbD